MIYPEKGVYRRRYPWRILFVTAAMGAAAHYGPAIADQIISNYNEAAAAGEQAIQSLGDPNYSANQLPLSTERDRDIWVGGCAVASAAYVIWHDYASKH